MTMTVKQKIQAGKKLRQFIDNHFVNYSDFARSLGTLPATVTHWMQGRNPVPIRIVERLDTLFPEGLSKLDKKTLRPDVYGLDNVMIT